MEEQEKGIFIKFCVEFVSCCSKEIRNMLTGKRGKTTHIQLSTDSDDAMVFYMIKYYNNPQSDEISSSSDESLESGPTKKMERLSGLNRDESISYYCEMKDKINKIRQQAYEEAKGRINKWVWDSYHDKLVPKSNANRRSASNVIGAGVGLSVTMNKEIIAMTKKPSLLGIDDSCECR